MILPDRVASGPDRRQRNNSHYYNEHSFIFSSLFWGKIWEMVFHGSLRLFWAIPCSFLSDDPYITSIRPLKDTVSHPRFWDTAPKNVCLSLKRSTGTEQIFLSKKRERKQTLYPPDFRCTPAMEPTIVTHITRFYCPRTSVNAYLSFFLFFFWLRILSTSQI